MFFHECINYLDSMNFHYILPACMKIVDNYLRTLWTMSWKNRRQKNERGGLEGAARTKETKIGKEIDVKNGMVNTQLS